MPGCRKGHDLLRDPRFALHGPASSPDRGEETSWPGEAKIAGRARYTPLAVYQLLPLSGSALRPVVDRAARARPPVRRRGILQGLISRSPYATEMPTP